MSLWTYFSSFFSWFQWHYCATFNLCNVRERISNKKKRNEQNKSSL